MAQTRMSGLPDSARIRCLRWTPYRVPFLRPFTTAHGEQAYREGLIVRIERDDGIVGTGEAAPLPEFDGRTGTVESCARLLRTAGMVLAGSPINQATALVSSVVAGKPGGGAVLAAVDSAALDACGRRTGQRLAEHLGGARVERVAVNATIGAETAESAVSSAREAVGRGFQTIKLKVGVSADPDDEVKRVEAVRAAIGPDIRLRLDGNGGWTLERAAAILPRLEPFNVELIEQPVAAEDTGGLAELRQLTSIPVAADEALTGVEALHDIIERQAADAIIIKPSLRGGPSASLELAGIAQDAGLRVTITSAFEAGVGLATALQVAALIPANDDPSIAHGLATADLLESTLLRMLPEVINGSIALPTGPGNGVDVDEAALARYATGPEVRA